MNKCKNCLADIPNERKFCGSSCAATYNNRLYPKRTNGRIKPNCLSCGCTIQNGRYDRKYCNIQCQMNKRKSFLLEKVKNEDFENLGNKASIDRSSKKYLIQLHGDKCMKCGC